jgi:hypothetical protein
MQNHLKKGELVFLPSDITLVKIKEGKDTSIHSWTKTKEPRHVLVVETKMDNYIEILYDGAPWLAKSIDVYPLIKGAKS